MEGDDDAAVLERVRESLDAREGNAGERVEAFDRELTVRCLLDPFNIRRRAAMPRVEDLHELGVSVLANEKVGLIDEKRWSDGLAIRRKSAAGVVDPTMLGRGTTHESASSSVVFPHPIMGLWIARRGAMWTSRSSR